MSVDINTTTQKVETAVKAEANKFWKWIKKGTHYAVLVAGLFALLWAASITLTGQTNSIKSLDARVKALEEKAKALGPMPPAKTHVKTAKKDCK